MRRIIPLFLYALISFLIVSCQQRMQSESGLYNVTLQKNIKVPVNGYWTWGKGNPYAGKKDLRIYIHPMDVSRIMKKDPEAAPVMAIQMQDYMVQAIAAAINDANAANKTNISITTTPSEADVCIHTALVDFRCQRPVLKTANAVGGSFVNIPGFSNVMGYISNGNIVIECTMRDTRTGQLLMAFKDANRKSVRIYHKEAYSYTGNADANLKEWAAMMAKVIRAAAYDKLGNSTLQKKIEERSYWEVFSQRAYNEIPDKEEINAWEAFDY